MKHRLVLSGLAVAATAALGITLPATAAPTPAAARHAAAAAAVPAAGPGSCAVSVSGFRVLAVSRAVGYFPVRLRTTCALKAPVTLAVRAIGGTSVLGTLVWRGTNGVVGNGAVGAFGAVARNYRSGHVYALPAQRVTSADGTRSYATAAGRFRVVALGRTAFTSVTLDRATQTLDTTGQDTVFSFAGGRMVKRGGPTVGYYREGTKGAFHRDTMDPRIRVGAGGRLSWVLPVRCGVWQYRMVQPPTRALLAVSMNYAYSTRAC